jgi:hypothetical protein
MQIAECRIKKKKEKSNKKQEQADIKTAGSNS